MTLIYDWLTGGQQVPKTLLCVSNTATVSCPPLILDCTLRRQFHIFVLPYHAHIQFLPLFQFRFTVSSGAYPPVFPALILDGHKTD